MRASLLAGMALIGSGALWTAPDARAAAYTETATFGPATGGYTQTLTFNPFNASLGTLTGVTVQAAADGNFSGTVTNTGGSSQTFRVVEEVSILFGNSTPSIDAFLLTLVGQQTFTNLRSGASASFGPLLPNDAAPMAAGAPLSDYTGSLISATITTRSSTQVVGNSGTVATAITATSEGSITLTFNYDAATSPPTAVPEPASILLLGIGVAGMAAVRRRRAG